MQILLIVGRGPGASTYLSIYPHTHVIREWDTEPRFNAGKRSKIAEAHSNFPFRHDLRHQVMAPAPLSKMKGRWPLGACADIIFKLLWWWWCRGSKYLVLGSIHKQRYFYKEASPREMWGHMHWHRQFIFLYMFRVNCNKFISYD